MGQRLVGRSIGTEVGLALSLAPTTGNARVADAVAGVANHPGLLALLISGTGRVSAAGLRKVLKVTAVLDPALRRTVDEQLVADASSDRLTPGQLETAVRRVVAADPDAALARCARARLDRRVGLLDKTDGTASLWAKLLAEEAVAVYTHLDTHARALRAAGDPRPLTTLMADLLVDAVLHTCHPATGGHTDTAPGDHTDTEPGDHTDTDPGDHTEHPGGESNRVASRRPWVNPFDGLNAALGDPTGDGYGTDPDPWDTSVPDPFAPDPFNPDPFNPDAPAPPPTPTPTPTPTPGVLPGLGQSTKPDPDTISAHPRRSVPTRRRMGLRHRPRPPAQPRPRGQARPTRP
ncbi:MAG: hypothetical protein ACRDP1_04300 [Nocardioidaceae bacterium]